MNTITTENKIKPGYKKTPVGIIPEDWEVKKIKDLSSRIGDGIHSTPKYTENEEYFFINGNNLKEGRIVIDENTKTVTEEESFKHKRDLNDRTILMSINGTIGNLAFYKNEKVMLGKSACYLNILKEIDIKYFYFQIGSYSVQKSFLKRLTGSTIMNLGLNEIRKTKLPIPPLPEQEAIADCLSTWDKGIEKLSALIASKKEQKKGLMQQIFNGQLKVENGELVKVEDEKLWLKGWKEVRLGDLGKTFNGLTGKTKDDFGVGLPFVSYLNVFRNNKIEENTSFDYVNIESSENQNTLNYGDLIFTTSSETPNEVGISSVVLFKPKEKLYLNSFCFGMRLNDFSILKPEYAVYLLRGQNFRREMYKLAQGSTRYNLSKASFVKIQITVPSLEEQTAIAEVLTTADKEIELLEKKLEAFKIQKKGLMQVLLTGTKRLVE